MVKIGMAKFAFTLLIKAQRYRPMTSRHNPALSIGAACRFPFA
jgi:hypothetical protein